MRAKYYVLLLAIVLSSLVVGCAAPSPAAPQTAPQVTATPLAQDVTPETVEQLRSSGAAVIIDVREPEEYAEGRIPGAVLIPLGELPQRLDEIPTDVPVVMVCRSGNRSAQALQLLQKSGFTNVHNMLGGMKAWATAGYEIEAER